jgi:hypothetical protein
MAFDSSIACSRCGFLISSRQWADERPLSAGGDTVTMRDYVILFHPSLIPHIEDGSKNLTYRLDDDGLDYLKVGDCVEAEDSETGERFAELEITSLEWTTFGELPIDRKGNVQSESKHRQRETFKGYYGRNVVDGERALIIGFRLVRWLAVS